MKNKVMKNHLTKTCRYLKGNLPTMLSGIAVVGVVSTAIMVGITTSRTTKQLETMKKVKGKLTKRDILITVVPPYIPAVLIGGSTIACILGANVLNKRSQASLMSAYILADTSFKDYRKKLIELHGEEADIEIRDAIAREHCDFRQIGLETPDQKLMFYEEYSGTYLKMYEKELMDAEYHLNRNFVMRGYANLNEFYEFLCLPKTDLGESIGWSVSDGYYWIDFEHRLMEDPSGETCYAIDMFLPDFDYMREWE